MSDFQPLFLLAKKRGMALQGTTAEAASWVMQRTQSATWCGT